MHTRRNICIQFQEDWTTLKYRQLWRHGGYLGCFFENENSLKLNQDIHMHLHIKFRQDPTTFDKVRILAWNAFYVGRHSRHFENRSTSNLKWEALKHKLNLLVKTQCLYTCGFGGVVVTNFRKKTKWPPIAAILDFQQQN